MLASAAHSTFAQVRQGQQPYDELNVKCDTKSLATKQSCFPQHLVIVQNALIVVFGYQFDNDLILA